MHEVHDELHDVLDEVTWCTITGHTQILNTTFTRLLYVLVTYCTLGLASCTDCSTVTSSQFTFRAIHLYVVAVTRILYTMYTLLLQDVTQWTWLLTRCTGWYRIDNMIKTNLAKKNKILYHVPLLSINLQDWHFFSIGYNRTYTIFNTMYRTFRTYDHD